MGTAVHLNQLLLRNDYNSGNKITMYGKGMLSALRQLFVEILIP
jgi:hypothetical protein